MNDVEWSLKSFVKLENITGFEEDDFINLVVRSDGAKIIIVALMASPRILIMSRSIIDEQLSHIFTVSINLPSSDYMASCLHVSDEGATILVSCSNSQTLVINTNELLIFSRSSVSKLPESAKIIPIPLTLHPSLKVDWAFFLPAPTHIPLETLGSPLCTLLWRPPLPGHPPCAITGFTSGWITITPLFSLPPNHRIRAPPRKLHARLPRPVSRLFIAPESPGTIWLIAETPAERGQTALWRSALLVAAPLPLPPTVSDEERRQILLTTGEVSLSPNGRSGTVNLHRHQNEEEEDDDDDDDESVFDNEDLDEEEHEESDANDGYDAESRTDQTNSSSTHTNSNQQLTSGKSIAMSDNPITSVAFWSIWEELLPSPKLPSSSPSQMHQKTWARAALPFGWSPVRLPDGVSHWHAGSKVSSQVISPSSSSFNPNIISGDASVTKSQSETNVSAPPALLRTLAVPLLAKPKIKTPINIQQQETNQEIPDYNSEGVSHIEIQTFSAGDSIAHHAQQVIYLPPDGFEDSTPAGCIVRGSFAAIWPSTLSRPLANPNASLPSIFFYTAKASPHAVSAEPHANVRIQTVARPSDANPNHGIFVAGFAASAIISRLSPPLILWSPRAAWLPLPLPPTVAAANLAAMSVAHVTSRVESRIFKSTSPLIEGHVSCCCDSNPKNSSPHDKNSEQPNPHIRISHSLNSLIDPPLQVIAWHSRLNLSVLKSITATDIAKQFAVKVAAIPDKKDRTLIAARILEFAVALWSFRPPGASTLINTIRQLFPPEPKHKIRFDPSITFIISPHTARALLHLLSTAWPSFSAASSLDSPGRGQISQKLATYLRGLDLYLQLCFLVCANVRNLPSRVKLLKIEGDFPPLNELDELVFTECKSAVAQFCPDVFSTTSNNGIVHSVLDPSKVFTISSPILTGKGHIKCSTIMAFVIDSCSQSCLRSYSLSLSAALADTSSLSQVYPKVKILTRNELEEFFKPVEDISSVSPTLHTQPENSRAVNAVRTLMKAILPLLWVLLEGSSDVNSWLRMMDEEFPSTSLKVDTFVDNSIGENSGDVPSKNEKPSNRSPLSSNMTRLSINESYLEVLEDSFLDHLRMLVISIRNHQSQSTNSSNDKMKSKSLSSHPKFSQLMTISVLLGCCAFIRMLLAVDASNHALLSASPTSKKNSSTKPKSADDNVVFQVDRATRSLLASLIICALPPKSSHFERINASTSPSKMARRFPDTNLINHSQTDASNYIPSLTKLSCTGSCLHFIQNHTSKHLSDRVDSSKILFIHLQFLQTIFAPFAVLDPPQLFAAPPPPFHPRKSFASANSNSPSMSPNFSAFSAKNDYLCSLPDPEKMLSLFGTKFDWLPTYYPSTVNIYKTTATNKITKKVPNIHKNLVSTQEKTAINHSTSSLRESVTSCVNMFISAIQSATGTALLRRGNRNDRSEDVTQLSKSHFCLSISKHSQITAMSLSSSKPVTTNSNISAATASCIFHIALLLSRTLDTHERRPSSPNFIRHPAFVSAVYVAAAIGTIISSEACVNEGNGDSVLNPLEPIEEEFEEALYKSYSWWIKGPDFCESVLGGIAKRCMFPRLSITNHLMDLLSSKELLPSLSKDCSDHYLLFN